MTGCDLYKKLLPTISELKALFMSGYAPDVIASQGLLDEKIGFIQKPFRFKSLSAAVHETLASVTPPPPHHLRKNSYRKEGSNALTKTK